ncbi:3,4-dihydroxy-2-butanone-4-phosphate synthase [Endozoicomonas ascidiicola]|uniref:3,4-dihydroxy-2-butanone-4-phosphate synthase n=1 Tax=Endozoicomonas ascidiicola TaxID=1698521 RepID=UPI00083576DF|nr:3,4-dihydroxy-2-butanone-4-phosphate synthase [Endozoicomonas ascidiicola]
MTSVLSLDRQQIIENAIEEFRNGKFLLVSDDEGRENEGDLIVAAEHATPEAINFMITHGRGLVCLAISEEIAQKKQLLPMVQNNKDHMGTAFTASVDATLEYGVTTGISAWDRSKTIEVVIGDEYSPQALQAPGHMFPLVAKNGYLSARQGHTEAGVELCRLAGLESEAAVIVEVIREDGAMARRPELIEMAKKHNISYITIEELCKYIEQVESTYVAA